MSLTEILRGCSLVGNTIKLPEIILTRKEYLQVKKSLEMIGGKWKGGKTQAFVFATNPEQAFNAIKEGKKVNLKKDYQFFATPSQLADKLVNLASIDPASRNIQILEPSAGQGAIIGAINRHNPHIRVHYFELMEANQAMLEQNTMLHHKFLGADFLKCSGLSYDCIIANPPFRKNQDIEHVKKMYECLKVGGKLVSITSTHWCNSNNKKETSFRLWLKEVNAIVHIIDKGAFKTSGTGVGARILEITKC